MKPLEDLSYKELTKLTKKDIGKRLSELEVPYDDKWTKDELIDHLRAEGDQFDEKEVQAIEPETYLVLHSFKDLEDGGFVYIDGEKYPRKANKEVTRRRVNELLSNKNKIGKRLIKEQ